MKSPDRIALDGNVVLQARNVSKLFARRQESMRARLGAVAARALVDMRPPDIETLKPHEFWAVYDVSFDLPRGRALGIIGLNGSGKTTLLRMLAGQILPDRGEIAIKGSSAAMIDLHAGFQPAAPGRENIFLRSAALGFTRSETAKLVDEVIEFSELADAIDAPMATYSSGMKMRLAFSVMTMVKPDVLLIDEVLAVGDFRFRQKCLSKIREMREQSAFVFVSHSMGDIERFCDKVIVLHKGRVHFVGPPREAIEIYESLDHTNTPLSGANMTTAMGPAFVNESAISDVEHYWCDANGNETSEFKFQDPLYFKVQFRTTIDIRNLVVGVPIWNHNAQYTAGISTEINSEPLTARAGELVTLIVQIDGSIINPGTIKSVVGIVDGPEFLYRQPNSDIEVWGAPHPTWGAVTVPHSWRRVSNDEADTGLPRTKESQS